MLEYLYGASGADTSQCKFGTLRAKEEEEADV